MPRKKTKEEYIEQLKIKNPDVELIGDYIDDHTKVLHRCNKHNVLWDMSPNKALQGRGCKDCGRERYRNKRTKSEEQYIQELSITNPTIKLCGKYINNRTSIEHYCEIHDFIFSINPTDALRGNGCKYCKGDKIRNAFLKPKAKYIAELNIKNPNTAPITIEPNIDTSCTPFMFAITVKQVIIIAETLEDKPSIPSVKLIAFVVPNITTIANGIYSQTGIFINVFKIGIYVSVPMPW